MKYIILGDSISQGIGKKKIGYYNFLKEKLDEKDVLVNMAYTGTTINYAFDIIDKVINESPDVIIIMYGSVDAQIRANLDEKSLIYKFIPKRYKQCGMLDPRPFYSKKVYRFIPDRIDNFVRSILKKIVIKLNGTIQWVDISSFEQKYDLLIKKIHDNNIKAICISTMYIDDDLFCNSSSEYLKYNDVIKSISEKYDMYYFDVFKVFEEFVKYGEWLKYYSYDHFHPNENGYKVIADEIFKIITDC